MSYKVFILSVFNIYTSRVSVLVMDQVPVVDQQTLIELILNTVINKVPFYFP